VKEMAKFKITNLNEMSNKELNDKLDELNLTLIKQNAQRIKGASLENPKMIREVKKNIARIKQKLAEKKAR